MSKRAAIDLRKALAELLVQALERQQGAPKSAEPADATIATLNRYFDLATAARPSLPSTALPDPGDAPDGPLLEKRADGSFRLREEFLPFWNLARNRTRSYRRVLQETAVIVRQTRPGLHRTVSLGAALFKAHLFFETHELLEVAWRVATGESKTLLQGLVQIAVAFHHFEEGNLSGARSLLRKGRAQVASAPMAAPLAKLDVDLLLAETAPWADYLASVPTAPRAEAPTLPKLRFSV